MKKGTETGKGSAIEEALQNQAEARQAVQRAFEHWFPEPEESAAGQQRV